MSLEPRRVRSHGLVPPGMQGPRCIFVREIRRRFKNICFSHTKNLHQPASVGGQGYYRCSFSSANAPASTALSTRGPLDTLSGRYSAGIICPILCLLCHHSTKSTPWFWISRLISFEWKGNTCVTKQCSFPASKRLVLHCINPFRTFLYRPNLEYFLNACMPSTSRLLGI